MEEITSVFVFECFWPGVREEDVVALEKRVRASVEALHLRGARVRYLGSILMRDDEVLLCRFDGDASAVRGAAEQAAIPFARILDTVHTGGGLT